MNQSIIMEIKYNNLYTHFVFTTYQRKPIIPEKNRNRIEKYITGVVKNYGCKLYAIYANPEHIPFLVSRSPSISEQYLVNIIEESTTNFINDNKLVAGQFNWQTTSAAFSVSKKDVDRVCKYILTQKEHHRKSSFKEEYDKFIAFYEKTIHINK